MKTFAILSTFLFSFLSATSQSSSSKYTYLLVRISNVYDKRLDSIYSMINAENGNPYAQEIYQLRPFGGNKDIFWYTQNFFSHRTDSSKTFYNFVENTTEAMLFMSENGWELLSVNNDIKSTEGVHFSRDFTLPYTVTESSPVYYFRKIVKE